MTHTLTIPKIIHYCWFGGNPLPDSAKKCIASWKKFFPDYEIKEWNESNFDVNIIPYTEKAYMAKKYAFVSDYARLKILYENGGIYFDTDVEVIKSFDDILAKGPFMGCESEYPETSHINDPIAVNPGLGLAAPKGLPIYREMLDCYSSLPFLLSDGTMNPNAIVKITTDTLTFHGLKPIDKIQFISGINIYPKEFFNPFNDALGKLFITHNTHSIHWYAKSWLDVSPLRMKLSRLSHRVFGYELSKRIRRLLRIT